MKEMAFIITFCIFSLGVAYLIGSIPLGLVSLMGFVVSVSIRNEIRMEKGH